MKHFSAFIPRGAKRLELSGRWAGNAVAFQDENSTTVVVHNPFDKTRKIGIGYTKNYEIEIEPKSFTTIVLPS